MPSGDAQPAWFPEMIEALCHAWRTSPTWEQVIASLPRFDAQRARIWAVYNIRSPLVKCPYCGSRSRSELPRVSVRSLLFALEKSGIVPPDERKRLESDWFKCQKKNELDAWGNKQRGVGRVCCSTHPLAGSCERRVSPCCLLACCAVRRYLGWHIQSCVEER